MKQTKKKINSVSSNYVTTNTNQTISGAKVFEKIWSAIQIKSPDADVTVTPTDEEKPQYLYFTDKNDKMVSAIKSNRTITGCNEIGMFTTTPTSTNDGPFAGIHVRIKDDGTAETEAPEPSPTANGREIATIGWSNSKYVNLTDAQTINGTKYFKTTVCSVGTADWDNVETNQISGFAGVDVKGRYVSGITSGFYKNDTGNASFLRLLSAYNKGNDPNGVIAEFQKNLKDNTKWNYATSFLDHQTLDHIATIGWTIQQRNINEIVAWKIANNLCISVVQLVTQAGQMATYTYPIPYSVTPVTVGNVIGIRAIGSNNLLQYYCSIMNPTATSVQVGCIGNGSLISGYISMISIGFAAV